MFDTLPLELLDQVGEHLDRQLAGNTSHHDDGVRYGLLHGLFSTAHTALC